LRVTGAGLGPRSSAGASGLELLQFLDGLEAQAAGVIDAALEAGLGVGSGVEGLAGGAVGAGVMGVLDGVDQELGIDPGEANEKPGVADDVVDQEAFDVGLRLAALVEPCGKCGKSCGILAGDDVRFSVDSRLESIHAGGGLALGGAWACRVLRVAAVSLYLTKCGHFFFASLVVE
jgi:hypothetical protein